MKIAQLTDMHLQASADAYYKGAPTDSNLKQCLHWVADNQYDLLLLTGDLTQDGTKVAYQRLLAYVEALQIPWYWIPGNHDDTNCMLALDSQRVDQVQCVRLGQWNLILLNSTANPDGVGGGQVSPEHMQDLASLLETFSDCPTLLVIHHNPLAVDSAWQDKIMLANASDFCDLVANSSNVQGVIFGHIHQCLDRRINGTRYLGAPAVSAQFTSQQATFTVQPELGPGLRSIYLHAKGSLTTQVHYLPVSGGYCKGKTCLSM